jgi:PilZ domain
VANPSSGLADKLVVGAYALSLLPGRYGLAAARRRDRRRVPRYPCLARLHADDRVGVAVNISTDGLSFQTMDGFRPAECVELSLAFEIARAPLLEVVHVATIVWTRPGDGAGSWRVGVKFPH